MKRTFFCAFLLLLLGVMPIAEAKQPKLVIVNHSRFIKEINRKILYDYLSFVSTQWSIYQGTYYFYVSDELPSFLIIDPKALAGHTAQVKAYVNAKDVIESNFSIYYVMTHELVEMATDPYLNTYAMKDGEKVLVEVADPIETNYLSIDNEHVADFVSPDYYDKENDNG